MEAYNDKWKHTMTWKGRNQKYSSCAHLECTPFVCTFINITYIIMYKTKECTASGCTLMNIMMMNDKVCV